MTEDLVKLFDGFSQGEMILFGVMAILLVLAIVGIFTLTRRKKQAPATLPPLPLGIVDTDFRSILVADINKKTIRKATIEQTVKELEAEYNSIKQDLERLEKMRCQLL